MPSQKAKFKKRACSCPSLGCSSCREAASGGKKVLVTETTGVTGVSRVTGAVSGDLCDVKHKKMYKNRFVYNSNVVPSNVDALLVTRRHNCKVWGLTSVRPCVSSISQSGLNALSQAEKICNTSLSAGQSVSKVTHNDLRHPIVHPRPGVGEISVSNDHDTIKSSIKQLPDHITPGFESSSPSASGGDESEDSATAQVSSGRVSRGMRVTKVVGLGFESTASDPTVPVNVVCAEGNGMRDNCTGGDSSVVPARGDGHGFESGVKNERASSSTSANAVTVNANQVCEYNHFCEPG